MSLILEATKGQLVSAANQGFKRVVGNLRGVIDSSLNRGVTASEVHNPQIDVKAFTFPLDVRNPDQGLGNHGHYILFHINEQANAKISFGRKNGASKGSFSMRKAAAEHGDIPLADINSDFAYLVRGGRDRSGGARAEALSRDILRRGDEDEIFLFGDRKEWTDNATERALSTVAVKRKPTTKLQTSIALYMPSTVSVTHTANYTDTEIGSGAAQGLEIIKAMSRGTQSFLETAFSDVVTRDFVDGLRKAGLTGIGQIPGFQGSRELYEMDQGYIMTNRMELAFKGIPKRGFQYTFKMIPKSEQEAEEVKNIVLAFKTHMSPEGDDVGGTGLGFTGKNYKIPNTFQIKYMFTTVENSYLHKIAECVLESMNVTYGGERFKTFDGIGDGGAPPVETTMTLNFREMELITREKVREGY